MTPIGRTVRDGDGVRLELSRSVDALPAEVWAVLTDPGGAWFGTWTGDPASGTVVLQSVEGGDPGPVVVHECTAPSRLAVDLDSPDGTWPLEVDLVAEGSGTVVRLVHRLAEPYDGTSIGPGWHYYLDRLAAAVAGSALPSDFDPYLSTAPAYALPD